MDEPAAKVLLLLKIFSNITEDSPDLEADMRSP